VADFSHHEPCPACGSKDNLARYSDGTGYCFGCHAYFFADGQKGEAPEGFAKARPVTPLLPGLPEAVTKRSLDAETCRKFRYLSNRDQGVQLATYCDKAGRPVAQKVRAEGKDFRWVGDPKAALLFGQQLWTEGGRRVVVTEGEIDALSVSQAFNLKWPVVSIPNGAPGAKRDLSKHLEWLESFDEIVLMFDMDEQGRAAVAACAELFTPGKCRIAQLPLKDANEMLMAGMAKELVSAVWDAKPYRPEGLVEGIDLITTLLEKPVRGLDYPWACLTGQLYGMRTGEIVMWTGGTGTGKTQIVREIVYKLHRELGENVGVISLEETEGEAMLGQVSIELNKRLHLPDVRDSVPNEQIELAARAIGSGLWFYRSEAGFDQKIIEARIRQMVKGCGVRWVVLDHISMVVGQNATDGDVRKRIDELMYTLRRTVQQLGCGLHVVCHLRKSQGKPFEEGEPVTLDDLRDSGALKQVPNIIIAAERNQQADGPEASRMLLRVLKNRFAGRTGVAGKVAFADSTGRITEVTPFDDSPPPVATVQGQSHGDF